jgi:hypothetical protein
MGYCIQYAMLDDSMHHLVLPRSVIRRSSEAFSWEFLVLPTNFRSYLPFSDVVVDNDSD